MDTEIRYEDIENLCLDPLNPRLGRENTGADVSQDKVLSLMEDWTLDELATSFLENGFWPQEALVVVQEKLYGSVHKVVVEGNRRLAALRLLQNAIEGKPVGRKRTDGVQKYLRIYINADPAKAKKPVAVSRLRALAHFAQWLFGDEKGPPLFTDSRYVDNFGKVLESPKAVEYLERTPNPSFDFAL